MSGEPDSAFPEDWWQALLLSRHHGVVPDDVLRRLDAAERLVDERFGISTAYYVRANEAPGKSVRLDHVVMLVALAMEAWKDAEHVAPDSRC